MWLEGDAKPPGKWCKLLTRNHLPTTPLMSFNKFQKTWTSHRYLLKKLQPTTTQKAQQQAPPSWNRSIPIPLPKPRMETASNLEEGDTEMDLDEHDLVGIDLEHLEQAYHKKELYTIPLDQLRKVHKVFLNSSVGSAARSSSGLGIQGIQQKEQHKPQKEEKKRGRKSTQKLIQEIDHFMVNSGQIHLISDSFPPLPSPSSS
jgi:hypothetical protein